MFFIEFVYSLLEESMKIDNVYKRSKYELFCIYFQICNISQILHKIAIFYPNLKNLEYLFFCIFVKFFQCWVKFIYIVTRYDHYKSQ
jgi:phosphatidylglycerophosphate synthase